MKDDVNRFMTACVNMSTKLLYDYNNTISKLSTSFKRKKTKYINSIKINGDDSKSFLCMDVLRNVFMYSDNMSNFIKTSKYIYLTMSKFVDYKPKPLMVFSKLCVNCHSNKTTKHRILGYYLCDRCKSMDAYKFVYKTTLIKEYKLKQKDIKKIDAYEVKNPHYSTHSAYLYRFIDAKRLATR